MKRGLPMDWSEEAERGLKRVPFFVRKRVRRRVEEEAVREGAGKVKVHHLEAARKRFLDRMEEEVKGYQVEACFGQSGCPNRAIDSDDLSKKVEDLLSGKDLRGFLQKSVEGPLKMHHEFRVSISDCPNACSRPQIVDVGLIGACLPEGSQENCTRCGACLEVCRENAISLEGEFPSVDGSRCLSCGQCAKICPTGALREGKRGYRILVGGKLGRHPRLGEELPGIHTREEALKRLEGFLEHYLSHCRGGERFGAILERIPLDPEEEGDS
jgi:anaerobic sulfite reductase subunit C